MTTVTLPISTLARYIEEFKQLKLEHNREINVNDLEIDVPTPTGTARVRQFIKKCNLPILKITLSSGYSFKAATRHIVQKHGEDIFLEDLKIGDTIDHTASECLAQVVDIKKLDFEDCYDVAIDSPHLYCDANGVIHHNTITTATMAKICEKYGRTIVIVPNKSLVEQTEEDFINCQLDVGVYYGDRKTLNKTHTICTWQSLHILDKKSKDDSELLSLAEFLDGVSTVIVDEVHMAKAEVLKKILTQNLCNTPIRWGLTGTVPKEEIAFQTIRSSLGDVVHQVKASDLQELGVLSSCHVNVLQTAEWKEFGSYAEELKYLVTNLDRVKFVSDMISAIAEDGNTLVLVDRIECGKALQTMLSSQESLLSGKPDVPFISGAVKTKDRKEEYDEVKTSDNKIMIATYGVAAVGINVPRIFNLVMFEPGKSFVRVIQSIGRGVRKAKDKDHVNIYDITASTKYSKRHLTERKRFYKDANYPFTIKKIARPIS